MSRVEALIGPSQWERVKERPLGGYVDFDGANYRRSGSGAHDEGELMLQLSRQGFPVPTIVDIGETHYTEKALAGPRLLDAQQPEETFGEVLEAFTRAQTDHMRSFRDGDFEGIVRGIHLDNVLTENPDMFDSERVNIKPAIDKLYRRLSELPMGVCHGDFSPVNVFQDGVIDWEFSFHGPIGYDVLTLPKSPLLHAKGFRPTLDHDIVSQMYKSFCDEFELPDLTEYTTDFLFMKALFYLSHTKDSSINSSRSRDNWVRRKHIVHELSQRYLDGEADADLSFIDTAQESDVLQGAYAVIRDSSRVIMVKHAGIGSSTDLLNLPGGAMDKPGESIVQAASRETMEELGIDLNEAGSSISEEQPVSYVFPDGIRYINGRSVVGKWKGVVVFEVDDLDRLNIQLDPHEIAEAKIVEIAQDDPAITMPSSVAQLIKSLQ